MKNRKIIALLLAGIALLATVNTALYLCDEGEATIARGITLLDPAVEVSSFRVNRSGGTMLLAKSSEWRLVEPYSADVDEQAVMKLFDALSQTVIMDAISDSELLRLGRTRGDFDLEHAPLSVKVTSGDKSAEYRFGAMTPAGDGVYVAIDSVGAVFVMPSNLLAAVDVPVDGFRRRTLFDAVPETVAGFAVKRSSSSMMTFVREGETWKVDGANASDAKVGKFLSDVMSASAVEFVWPSALTNISKTMSAALLSTYGLDPESAVTLTFTGVDGGNDRISFGKAASEGEVYALVQRGSAIVTVPASLKERALEDVSKYTDARLFPFDASSVTAIAIADGEVSYSFSRDKSGGWRIETPVSAPADPECVGTVLNRILALSQADAAETGLAVSLSTNTVPVTVSRSAVLGDLRMEDLRSREILKIDPVTVKRIVMTPSDRNLKPTSVVYIRERRAWNVEQSEGSGVVDTGGVNSVLEAINPLRAERIEKLKVSASDLASYGLENPRLTVAVDQDVEKSVRRNIMLGNRVGDGCYATVGSTDAVFVISSESAGRISAAIVTE